MEPKGGADIYLNEVLAHVRWKRAHGAIHRELSDHIEDARLGFLAQGMSDDEAQSKAVTEMGDAAEVGARFDAAYRPAKNYGVWVPFALLFLFGALFRYIAGGSEAVSLGLLLFPAVFALLCFFPLGRLSRYGLPLYGLFLAVFAGWPLIRYFAHELPSSYLPYFALLFPVVFAFLIYRARGRRVGGLFLLIALFCVQGALYCFVLAHYYYIRFIFLCLVCLVELLYAVLYGWFFCKKYVGALAVLIPMLLFVAAQLIFDPNFFTRFSGDGNPAFMAAVKEVLTNTPWFGATNTGTLSEESLSFIDAAQQQGYFTNVYFLVWLSSNLGRFAFAAVIVLFAAFFTFALRASLRQKSMLYRLASLGITVHFMIDCAFNVLANLGLNGAVTFLPFVTGIGVSLLCNAALAGLLFSMLYNGAFAGDEASKKFPRWRLQLVKETE